MEVMLAADERGIQFATRRDDLVSIVSPSKS
jgi:hypothetical protein